MPDPTPEQAPEPPPTTYMAQFVQAAQELAANMATVRSAMTAAMRTFHRLHSVMQQAGMLDDTDLCDGCDRTDQVVTASPDGRALLCPDCQKLGHTGLMGVQQPERAPALSQLTTWHPIDCPDNTCDGTCTQPQSTPLPHIADSCHACWPHPCDPSRHHCQRHVHTTQQPLNPPTAEHHTQGHITGTVHPEQ